MIPAIIDTHVDEIYSIDIIEDASPLLPLQAQSYWQVRPAYYAQNVAGAINICYLRSEVISRLAQAASNIVKETGWRLVILDGWRPPRVQTALYKDIFRQICHQYPQESQTQHHQRTLEFVSLPSENPLCPSPHLTGGSVDVTLCDEQGVVLDMGSAFDEPSVRSYSDAFEHKPGPIRDRRRLLLSQMENVGFTNLPTEWWHFDYGNQNWAYYSGQAQAKYGVIYPS